EPGSRRQALACRCFPLRHGGPGSGIGRRTPGCSINLAAGKSAAATTCGSGCRWAWSGS
ncbi:unnamed protein product, partial [Phaeothamnion confervicola]